MESQFLTALQKLALKLSDNIHTLTLVTDAKRLTGEFASDKSSHSPSVPLAAVLPTTASHVAAVVKLCNEFNVPITPRGAGTGLEGGCIPYGKGVVIDTSNLQWIHVDVDNNCAWVGAGIKKVQLNKYLQKRHNLLFGPDPSSNPSVGGMVSTSGSGMSTLKYGTTRENIASLRVVTATGEILQTRRVVRKSSTGLDLTNLYCGSEGTLGVIVEVCVKLHPYLPHSSGGYAGFNTSEEAVKAVLEIRRMRLSTIVRCELLNTGGVRAANKEYGTELEARPTILFELHDANPFEQKMKSEFEQAAEALKRNGAVSLKYLTTMDEIDSIWEARRGCLYAAMKYRRRKGERILNTDVCVPIQHLGKIVTETEADFAKHNVPCIICAHISDGNFHTMIPHATDDEKKVAEGLESRMCQRALKFGGTVSGEHGVGIGKVKHLVHEHGAEHICVQKKIKEALDPKDLFNRGTFYPHSQERYGTAHL